MAKKAAPVDALAPTTEDGWLNLEFEITALFDGAPIDEENLFAGRSDEVVKMLRAVMERSKHVVLFGERGVGKTSLANVFWRRYSTTLKSFMVARVQAGPHDNFTSIWLRALEELQSSPGNSTPDKRVLFDTDFVEITPSLVRRELQKCRPNSLPIIIIDEYNEVVDADAKRLTANLIKELHDFHVSTTTILVGVAENISELIDDHQSIGRAIVQIPLSRMSEAELKEIISKRVGQTVMKFETDAVWTIVVLSRGLPFFTQTLSKHAALNAIEEKRIIVNTRDVDAAMGRFIEDAEVSFRSAYKEATRSNQENYFEQSLVACALARTDDEGFFTATNVIDPYSAIMKEPKRIAHFEKHLRRFSSDEGGNILVRRGGERQQTFRFSDPMMQPYVIIKGIKGGMIGEAARNLLLQREQRDLPI